MQPLLLSLLYFAWLAQAGELNLVEILAQAPQCTVGSVDLYLAPN